MSFEIDTSSFPQFLALIDRLPALAHVQLAHATQDAFGIVRPKLMDYPPPRSYIRTYKLRGGWGASVPEFHPQSSGFAFEATLDNPVRYGPYVQGVGEQAHMHVGYWDDDQTIIDDHAQEIEATYGRYADDLVRGLEG